MKKMFVSAIALVAFTVTGFANENLEKQQSQLDKTKKNFVHDCKFRVRDSEGNVLGTVTVYNVPTGTFCSDTKVEQRAREIWASTEP